MIDQLAPYLNPASPIVAVDLNNTIMDQIGGIVRASKGRLNRADFAQWDVDLSAKMGMSREAYLKWAWQNPYSELLSEPFPGTAPALWRVKLTRVQIWIATASVLSLADIRGWLNWHGIPHDRIIKTSDKAGLGDVLIDDSPTTCEKFYQAGLPILRYRLAWNEHLAHVPGVQWL